MVTDTAAQKIEELAKKHNMAHGMMRITVLGGGCSGFQYKLEMEDAKPTPEEKVFSGGSNNDAVIIDNISLSLIEGSELDYIETLGSAGFEVRNPNAKMRCGCGNSFNV